MHAKILKLMLFFMLISPLSATRRHSKPDTRVFIPTAQAQLEQNRVIDQQKLERITDEKRLAELLSEHRLVVIQPTQALSLGLLPRTRRACLPSTLSFLTMISEVYFNTFQQPLLVTSAVRPLTVQRRLLRWNRNAAPTTGPLASSHPTGATVDISRRQMTASQLRFMESLLLLHASLGRVIVLEEKHQACFHIFVIPKELP